MALSVASNSGINNMASGFSRICRTCAACTDCLMPIFSGEGLLNNLADKIHRHLPIQVSERDRLPQQLCQQCASTLLAWHELVKCCAQADAALRVRLQRLQELTHQENVLPPDPAPVLDKATPLKTEHDVKNSALKCEALADDKAQHLYRVELLSGKHRRNKSVCVVSDALAINSQIKVERLELENAVNSTMKIPPQREIFTTQDKQGHNEYVLTAPTPDVKPTIMLPEIKRKSNKKGAFTCSVCSQRLPLTAKAQHARTHRGELKHCCDVCGLEFNDRSNLLRHKRTIHSTVKPYICHICGATFSRKDHIKGHVGKHSHERRQVCDQCGKTFRTRASLKLHMVMHTDVLAHQCIHCGKQFKRAQELRNHASVHSGELPHVCKCGKRFRLRRQLADHEHRHLPDTVRQLYDCLHCPTKFKDKHYRNQHIKKMHKVGSGDE